MAPTDTQPDCAPPPTREELCKVMFDAADHDFGDQEEAFGAAVAGMATAILAACAAPQGADTRVVIETAEMDQVQIAFGVATTQTEIDSERRWQAIKLVSEFLGRLRLFHCSTGSDRS